MLQHKLWNMGIANILLAISFFLFTDILSAQESGVVITLPGKELIETEPRKTITASFLVANKTADNQEFTTELKLPEGWSIVINDLPFELDANKSDVRMVSFLVPYNALADKYEVTYSVKARDKPSIIGFCNLYVVVLPVNVLEVKLINAPEYVLAGDTYQISFTVINECNAKKTVIIEANSKENLPFIFETQKLEFAPSESKTVTVTVNTDGKIRKPSTYQIELTARVVDNKNVKAQALSSVDIIPRITGDGERFHRLPIQIVTSGNLYQRDDETNYGLQTEVSGRGTIDNNYKRNIDFLFKSPEISNGSASGEKDEYRFDFWTKNYKLGFGDDTYSLTTLTENYSYGRGISGERGIDKFRFGTYYKESRWGNPKQRSIAGYINFIASAKYKLSLNYLRKKGYSDFGIISLYGQLRPAKSINIEMEFATRKFDYAYLINAYGYQKLISYYAQLLHAEPDYPGYYKDRDSFSANAAVPIWKRLRINGSFRQETNNLNLDTTISSAYLERCYQSGLSYSFFSRSSISIDYTKRIHRDRFPLPKINRDDITYRLGASQGIKIINLSASFDHGKSIDNLTGQNSELEVYNFLIHFTPVGWLSFGGYVNYRNNINPTGEKQKNKSIGFDSSVRIDNKSYFKFSFRNSKSQYTNRNYISRNFNFNFAHTLWNKHKISASGRYTVSGDHNTIAMKVEYSVPINVPVCHKKDIGTVKGRVYDDESKKPISNIIFILNQATAVSDKNGNFIFPFIKLGNFKLYVNLASIGAGRVIIQKIPMEVNIEDGKNISIEIGITRSSTVSGQVMVYDFDKTKGNAYDSSLQNSEEKKIVESRGLANTVIELTSEKETKRRATNSEGRFNFDGLRPGKWTLKVYDDDLPEYHNLEKNLIEYDLKSGESTTVLLKVLPRVRRVNIIKDGEIILK
jgi:hypothetical protein